MNVNIFNKVPYLRTSRAFPEDANQLSIEVTKAYIDIANTVNNRTISIFPTTNPAVTGESWFITSQKQQTLRKTYAFTSTASINHGISVKDTNQFTRCFGSYTDGTNSFGLIWGTSSATTIPGQISFYVTSTQIVFVVDGAAPALSKGRITLEWLVPIQPNKLV